MGVEKIVFGIVFGFRYYEGVVRLYRDVLFMSRVSRCGLVVFSWYLSLRVMLEIVFSIFIVVIIF